jgi:hypothetical protein
MIRLECQKDLAFKELDWNDGIGRYSFSTPFQYNRAYFERYLDYDNTPLGRAITKFRVRIVNKLVSYRRRTTHLLDVGSGTGKFLLELQRTTPIKPEGIDPAPDATSWLHHNKLTSTRDRYNVLTFWDSLQHISEPHRLFEEYSPKHVAVSIPIYNGKESIRNHTKFKPDQYKWYFTRKGFIDWMSHWGYELVDSYRDEDQKFDHVAVQSFTFARKE